MSLPKPLALTLQTDPGQGSTSAQRALLRLLKTAIGDEPRAKQVVADSLFAARLTCLPRTPEDLRMFARAHLVAALTERVGPRLVSALLSDLDGEIDEEIASGEAGPSRITVATRVYDATPSPFVLDRAGRPVSEEPPTVVAPSNSTSGAPSSRDARGGRGAHGTVATPGLAATRTAASSPAARAARDSSDARAGRDGLGSVPRVFDAPTAVATPAALRRQNTEPDTIALPPPSYAAPPPVVPPPASPRVRRESSAHPFPSLDDVVRPLAPPPSARPVYASPPNAPRPSSPGSGAASPPSSKSYGTPSPFPSSRKRPSPLVRRAVALVDADRFGRSSLARALVQARCDVTVLDAYSEMTAIAQGAQPLDAIVTELEGGELVTMLRSMSKSRPNVPVIAWTRTPRAVAERILRTTGIHRFEIVVKTAPATEVIEALLRLTDA